VLLSLELQEGLPYLEVGGQAGEKIIDYQVACCSLLSLLVSYSLEK
jgi:hypothetical protein